MSHVEMIMFLFCNHQVNYKIAQCRMFNFRNDPGHVVCNISYVDKPHVICQFKELSVSPCRV